MRGLGISLNVRTIYTCMNMPKMFTVEQILLIKSAIMFYCMSLRDCKRYNGVALVVIDVLLQEIQCRFHKDVQSLRIPLNSYGDKDMNRLGEENLVSSQSLPYYFMMAYDHQIHPAHACSRDQWRRC